GQMLQPSFLFGEKLFYFLLPIGKGLLTPAEVAGPFAELLVALFEHLDLSVENGLLLGGSPLVGLDLFPSAPDLELRLLAKLDDLLFPGDQRGLLEVVGFALGVGDDALRQL